MKIAELDKLAKFVYDRWFVEFEFPDVEGRPYKSSGGKMVWNEMLKHDIPAGWGDIPIGELCICHDSKRIPLSNKQRETMKGTIPYYGATGIMDYVNDAIFEGDYLLLAEDGSIMTKQGTPILQTINGKTWVNNHAHVLSAKNRWSTRFLQLHFSEIPVRKIKTGSIQPKITKENLFAYRVLKIPESILTLADELFGKTQKLADEAQKEMLQLVKLRDWLLPMLMNGQVEVTG